MYSERTEKLIAWFKQFKSALVAFSGGVDSAVLARAAFEALGDNALAITARSSTMPNRELREAIRIAREIGIAHEIIEEDELEDENFVKNPKDRCYFCRKKLGVALLDIARKRGFDVVVDGANLSDTQEHRPGLKALKELGIRSPLIELGYTKEDVRAIAGEFNLSVHKKPPQACLASRIPYGDFITRDKLSQIERAEDYLLSLGFSQVRVRHHGSVARIEVFSEEIPKVIEHREKIYSELKKLGFNYVALDLKGYRSGSMDEVL